MRLISKVIIVSAGRFSATADFTLHFWDVCTKMRNALINKWDIMIHLDYLVKMKIHRNR